MPLPDHVKKLAFDAVEHSETAAMIRQFSRSEAEKPVGQEASKAAPQYGQELTPEVIAKGRDAVSHSETMAQIRLVCVNEIEAPLATPTPSNTKASQQIAHMAQSGHDVDTIHQAATKDSFGRE